MKYKFLINKRIAYLINQENVEAYIKSLKEIQWDHTPYFNEETIEDLAYLGVIKFFNDQKLDFLWYAYKNEVLLRKNSPTAA